MSLSPDALPPQLRAPLDGNARTPLDLAIERIDFELARISARNNGEAQCVRLTPREWALVRAAATAAQPAVQPEEPVTP